MAITYDSPISVLDLSTQAPRILAEAGIATIGALLDRSAEDIAELHGMGDTRFAELEDALSYLGLAFGRPLPDLGRYKLCTACPACPECGNPRADSARNVVVDLAGRASHIGRRDTPTCDDCDQHHRALFAGVAA